MAGSVFVTNTEFRVPETVGSVVETISRTGSTAGAVTITYGITADTATAGLDYAGGFGTVVMPAGASSVSVPIQIYDDALPEPTEVFVFSIVNVDGATLFAPRTSRIAILDDETPAPPPPVEPPLTSAYNIAQVPVVSGLDQPIRLDFSPVNPNLVYVAEKSGVINVANIATGTYTTMLDISDRVNAYGDRGLLDIALHPDFAHNPYIYGTITVDPPETLGVSGAGGNNGAGNRYSELVRWTADASTGYTTIVPGSETVLIGKAATSLADVSGQGWQTFNDPALSGAVSSERYINTADTTPPVVINGIKQDFWKADGSSHVGGGLAFGPDGALYVSVGDATSFDYADPRTVDVQNLDSLSGKILRVDPMTGQGLADNPFVTPGLSLDTDRAKIFQYGLRNPFSITFDGEGRLFISETGWNSWEEINTGGPGANFGWPYFEGKDGGVQNQTTGYRDFASAAAFYAGVANGSIVTTPAFRAFAHDSTEPGFQVQAITAGHAIYTGGAYPASLLNNFLFSDFPQGEVYAVNVNDRTLVQYLYNSASGYAPTDFVQGPDGKIYYVDITSGVLGRLDITDKGTPPPPPPPTTGPSPVDTTIGTGPDTLVLKVSQDLYAGNALYTITVDGVQVGGTLNATATKSSALDDTVTVHGTWATGQHALVVTFLNDAWGGSLTTDRNLYIDGVTYNGVVVSNVTTGLYSTGPAPFTFFDTGSTTPTPPGGGTAPAPATATLGSGADTLVVKISQDAYLGDALYTISVDGVQVGGTQTAAAWHANAQDDTITVLGTWAPGAHTLTVTFLNDAYGGTAALDRNLYVDGVTYDGVAVPGAAAKLASAGGQPFAFTDIGTGTTPPTPPTTGAPTPVDTTIGSGADTLVLKVSQDFYLVGAQYTVAVDGVAVGGTLTATAWKSSGLDDTVTVKGNWAPGAHSVTVNFLNDAYGGTATTDRNLYVDGVTYNGVVAANFTTGLYSGGPASIGFTDTGTVTTPPTGGFTPTTATIGAGTDRFVLKISQDAYNGSALCTVSVDGAQIGTTQAASALKSAAQDDTLTVLGNWAPGPHQVTVNFLNDEWGGSLTADRNLFIDGVTYDGVTVANYTTGLYSTGGATFTVADTSPLG